MSQGLEAPHPGFRPPRIPLDLRCILLAAAGVLLLTLTDEILSSWWGCASPIAQLMGLLLAQIGRVAFLGEGFRLAIEPVWGVAPYDLTWGQGLGTAAIFLAVWSVFGGAILRTSALRLSRDESLSLGESMRFGFVAAKDLLLAPVLVLLFAGFFTLLNLAAGLVMSLWVVGSSILSLILFPLALLSSLLILLSLAGGLVGLPLMWTGAAVERNGSLEAVSRSFSYISARPFRFLFGYLLVFILMSVIMIVGDSFEETAKKTLQAGIVRSDLDNLVSRAPSPDVLDNPARNHERVLRENRGIAALPNIRNASWTDAVGFLWMWFFLNLFLLGFKGYAIYALLGGTVSIYLELRREVDGTAEDQMGGLPEAGSLATEPEARWVGGATEAPSGENQPPAAE